MIHDTAIIDSGAQIGENVSIGPYTYIEGDVSIGDGCKIGPHVSILRYTTIGNDCTVHAGAVLGDIPQDLGFEEQESYVKIGDGCRMREGVTIHRGSKPGTTTELGKGCFLMAFAHVGHNVKLGESVIMVNGSMVAGYVEAGNGAFISGNVAVHQFVKIGRLVMLGGGASVSKDVPPFLTLRPAGLNDVAGINAVGMKRAGMNRDDLSQVKTAFKIIYGSGLNTAQAVDKLTEESSDGPVREFVEFINASKRGIC